MFDILINSYWVWSPICKYYSKALWWIALRRQLIWPLHLTTAIFYVEPRRPACRSFHLHGESWLESAARTHIFMSAVHQPVGCEDGSTSGLKINCAITMDLHDYSLTSSPHAPAPTDGGRGGGSLGVKKWNHVGFCGCYELRSGRCLSVSGGVLPASSGSWAHLSAALTRFNAEQRLRRDDARTQPGFALPWKVFEEVTYRAI